MNPRVYIALGLLVTTAGISMVAVPAILNLTQTSQPRAPDQGSQVFYFAAAGDHSFGPVFSSSLVALSNSGADFYLALGDLAYRETSERNWCETFKRSFDNIELITGNHDSGEEPGDGNIDAYVDNCRFTLGSLSGNYGKEYFFDYPRQAPLARFIMISPGVNMSLDGTGLWKYSKGDAHYSFAESAITESRTLNIPWTIVAMHKNCITAGAHNCEIGSDLWNLLLNEKVDMVLQAHDHNYQRSKQLSCAPPNTFQPSCVANETDEYVKGEGPTLVVQGTFGAPLAPINSADKELEYFAKTDSSTQGFVAYTVRDNRIDARFVPTSGGNFTDSFSIVKHSPQAQTLDQLLHTSAKQANILDPRVTSGLRLWCACDLYLLFVRENNCLSDRFLHSVDQNVGSVSRLHLVP